MNINRLYKFIRRNGGTVLSALLLTPVMLLTSCRHKDLYMDEDLSSELQIVFNWEEAPDANPSAMAVYLYEMDGHTPLRYIFDNKDGGKIKAPIGTHHAICINADDTDWARLRNQESVETLEISTQDADDLSGQSLRSSAVPRAEGTEEERMAQTPGMIWGSREDDIKIMPHTGMQTITLYPHEAVCHYIVDIYDVDNLEGVESGVIDGTLSGMAEGYCHGSDLPTDTPVTMPFPLKTDTSEGSLHSEFLTFGECGHLSEKHYLTVYMVLTDGSQWWHNYDVTDQVTGAADPHHVHIVVRGLPLPEPPEEENPSGLKPDVNEWQPVNISLKM